jgi:hypothetical protein
MEGRQGSPGRPAWVGSEQGAWIAVDGRWLRGCPFAGFSRYILVVVLLFIGLERLLRRRWLFWGYLGLSICLLLVLTHVFSEHLVVA